MRFVELHCAESSDRIIVNVDKIITIEPGINGSTLTLIDCTLDVQEKPDEIILKIRG